jgi:uncharacterized protein YpmB
MKTKSTIIGIGIIIAILLCTFTMFFVLHEKPVTLTQAEYRIQYQDPLTTTQKMELSKNLINGFYPSCKPTKIMVDNGVIVMLPTDCISAVDLKAASDRCLGRIGRVDEVIKITLNNNQIYPK